MIFIDTGALVARFVARDQHHEEAVREWGKLRQQPPRMFTSNFVLDETLSLLARRAGISFAASRGRSLYASEELTILRPGASDESAALAELERFGNKLVSFTDCVSFVMMRERGIDRVFGFDRHFEDAGFRMLP